MRTIAIRAIVFAAASLLATPSPAVESDHATQSTVLQYEMSVSADGRATSLKSINPVPDDVDQKIQRRVRSFSFEPATVNGIPQPATTTLYLTLGRIELPDGTTGYGITDLGTGPKKLANQTFETLPRLAEAGYVVIAYDRNGRVTRAEMEESATSPARPQFRKWATRMAKSFKFVPETVAGNSIPAQVRVGFVFCGVRECPKLQSLATGKELGGDLVADSVLKLKSLIGNSAI